MKPAVLDEDGAGVNAGDRPPAMKRPGTLVSKVSVVDGVTFIQFDPGAAKQIGVGAITRKRNTASAGISSPPACPALPPSCPPPALRTTDVGRISRHMC